MLRKKENPDYIEKEILRIVIDMERRCFDYVGYSVQKETEEMNKSIKKIKI